MITFGNEQGTRSKTAQIFKMQEKNIWVACRQKVLFSAQASWDKEPIPVLYCSLLYLEDGRDDSDRGYIWLYKGWREYVKSNSFTGK